MNRLLTHPIFVGAAVGVSSGFVTAVAADERDVSDFGGRNGGFTGMLAGAPIAAIAGRVASHKHGPRGAVPVLLTGFVGGYVGGISGYISNVWFMRVLDKHLIDTDFDYDNRANRKGLYDRIKPKTAE